MEFILYHQAGSRRVFHEIVQDNRFIYRLFHQRGHFSRHLFASIFRRIPNHHLGCGYCLCRDHTRPILFRRSVSQKNLPNKHIEVWNNGKNERNLQQRFSSRILKRSWQLRVKVVWVLLLVLRDLLYPDCYHVDCRCPFDADADQKLLLQPLLLV